MITMASRPIVLEYFVVLHLPGSSARSGSGGFVYSAGLAVRTVRQVLQAISSMLGEENQFADHAHDEARGLRPVLQTKREGFVLAGLRATSGLW